MVRLIQFLLILVTTSVRSRLSLQAENAVLRNQLSLYRKSGQRPRITPADRLLWCFITKIWVGWILTSLGATMDWLCESTVWGIASALTVKSWLALCLSPRLRLPYRFSDQMSSEQA